MSLQRVHEVHLTTLYIPWRHYNSVFDLFNRIASDHCCAHSGIEDKYKSMVSRTFQTLHLRLDLIEKILYDGKLLWKIDNFKRRHHEAVIGIRRSIFSVPFYTSSQGYKMCASVFLNGNDEGRGQYSIVNNNNIKSLWQQWQRKLDEFLDIISDQSIVDV